MYFCVCKKLLWAEHVCFSGLVIMGWGWSDQCRALESWQLGGMQGAHYWDLLLCSLNLQQHQPSFPSKANICALIHAFVFWLFVSDINCQVYLHLIKSNPSMFWTLVLAWLECFWLGLALLYFLLAPTGAQEMLIFVCSSVRSKLV